MQIQEPHINTVLTPNLIFFFLQIFNFVIPFLCQTALDSLFVTQLWIFWGRKARQAA